MKKSLHYIVFSILIVFVSSCQNKPEELKHIPKNADFVFTFLPSQLQNKSGITNFSETSIYQTIISDTNEEVKNHLEQFDYILQNGEESGLNLKQNVFLFSTNQHNGFYQNKGVSFGISDPAKFKTMIEKMLQGHPDSAEIIKEEGVHYLLSKKANSNFILAWNKDAAIGLTRSKGKNFHTKLKEEAAELLNQSKGNSIASDDDFLDFYDKRKDFSLWLNSDFLMTKLPSEYQLLAKMQLPIKLDDIHYHFFIAFEKGEAIMTSSLKLSDELEDFIEDYKIIKDNFDVQMLQYLPQNSFANFSFAIDPYEFYRMIVALYAERQIDTEGMKGLIELGLNTDIEKTLKAFSGECIINFHDVKIVNQTTISDSASENSNDTTYELTPRWMFSALIKMDNDTVYQWFLDKMIDHKEQMTEGYFELNDNPNQSYYASMVDHYMMLTNDQQLIRDFSNKQNQKPSLADSDIGKHLSNYAVYAKINMDYSAYPKSVQEYYDTTYMKEDKLSMRTKLSEIIYNPNGSYSSSLIMKFKDKETNSLKLMMRNND